MKYGPCTTLDLTINGHPVGPVVTPTGPDTPFDASDYKASPNEWLRAQMVRSNGIVSMEVQVDDNGRQLLGATFGWGNVEQFDLAHPSFGLGFSGILRSLENTAHDTVILTIREVFRPSEQSRSEPVLDS